MMRTLTLVATALFAAGAANAADIQKCADPDGGITYQDSPCPSGTTIGTLPRAPAYADPAALRLAESERLRLERAQESRARLAVLDASREAIARGAPPRFDVPVYDVAPPAPYEPYYYAAPAYPPNVRSDRSRNRGAAVAPGTLASPGILDTPAPCNTLKCRQQRADRAAGGRR
jgi:hypothetical protein